MRYTTALKFFAFCEELKPRWVNSLFGQAVTYFKLGKFLMSRDAVEIAIGNYKNDAFEEEYTLQYFRAMCYKNLGNNKLA